MSEDKPTDLGSTGAHEEALALARLATEQRRRCAELSGGNTGRTVTKACENLISRAQANERKADRMNQTSQALKIREEAARVWNRNAPRDSELAAASKSIAAASEELKRAANADEDTTAAQHAWHAAVAHSADLNERRKQADADYERAEQRAKDKLAKLKGRGRPAKGVDGGADDYSTPGNGKPTAAPHSKSTLPSTTPAKSATGAAAPRTTASSAPSAAATSASNEALNELVARLHPKQQQTPIQQAPPQATPPAQAPTLAAPAAAASPSRPENRRSVEETLGNGGLPDIPVAVGVNPSPATNSSASGTSTAQHAPATSGTSAKELHTDANVTGRSEGPRTFASGATSKLNNTTGFQGSAQPQTAAAHAGMGQPVAAPMGASASAGTSKSSAKIQSAQSKLDYEEGVVPGGTIAQNRPDDGGGK
ncbi:hypothetical protein IUQ79_00985 [Mycobacteroides abscessus subsp. bolletii]|uniref:hypothetical protein n=1 Tax=Mycobacteroides abscessus TaxID=36809 RepID=UPI0019D0BED5|nr:hypothetical protein [Mycobacteroides abscessus]MBN7300460.1 hypothetical protein [Mycobacteroides abscessus subsp. bolletii]